MPKCEWILDDFWSWKTNSGLSINNKIEKQFDPKLTWIRLSKMAICSKTYNLPTFYMSTLLQLEIIIDLKNLNKTFPLHSESSIQREITTQRLLILEHSICLCRWLTISWGLHNNFNQIHRTMNSNTCPVLNPCCDECIYLPFTDSGALCFIHVDWVSGEWVISVDVVELNSGTGNQCGGSLIVSHTLLLRFRIASLSVSLIGSPSHCTWP